MTNIDKIKLKCINKVFYNGVYGDYLAEQYAKENNITLETTPEKRIIHCRETYGDNTNNWPKEYLYMFLVPENYVEN